MSTQKRLADTASSLCPDCQELEKGLVSMHATTWINNPVNSPDHYTRSHPGMECIDLTADTTFCLGNAIKYLWRYRCKGRPVEDLEKARWYLRRLVARGETIAWTPGQVRILTRLRGQAEDVGNDTECRLWRSLTLSPDPEETLKHLDHLINQERNQQ